MSGLDCSSMGSEPCGDLFVFFGCTVVLNGIGSLGYNGYVSFNITQQGLNPI